MKNKLNLEDLKVKSFVVSNEDQIKETIKGGGVGPWSYPCNQYTKVKGCDEPSAFLTCNNTEVAVCGQLTFVKTDCIIQTGHGGCATLGGPGC